MCYKYFKNIIVPLLVGLISGLGGAYIAVSHLSMDKKTELLYIITNDKRKLFTETCKVINTRLFFHRSIVWKIDNIYSKENINDIFLEELYEIRKNWLDSIINYNIEVRKISNQLKFIYNESIEKMFAFDNDSDTNPTSISGNFIKIQKETENLLNYIRRVKNNSIEFNNQEYIAKLNNIKYELEKLQTLVIDFMKIFAKETFVEHQEFEKLFSQNNSDCNIKNFLRWFDFM